MNIDLDKRLIETYDNSSQKIRVITEGWVKREIFCPNCGQSLQQYPNNKPVADFYCYACREEYELKSKKDNIGNRVIDGAYATMLKRLMCFNNPSFFFLNYSPQHWEVLNFFVIPKHFFTSDIIEKRKPLSQDARRHGWTGCNILLQSIPEAGKIYFIRNRTIESKEKVIAKWQRTLFLREAAGLESRGWTLTVMRCIDQLAKTEFILDDVYAFEPKLKNIYPDNKHIKDKIRQQLQILRDKGYLEFIGRGKYRLAEFITRKGVERKRPIESDIFDREKELIDQIELEINEKLKYVEYLPVYTAEAACGGFGRGLAVECDGWIKVEGVGALSRNMYVVKAHGKSMEPLIKDGSYCVFRMPTAGSRNNKVVLVEHHGISDPDHGGKFTIKRYKSEKSFSPDGTWQHERIVLKAENKDYEDIVVENADDGEFFVVGELVGVVEA